MLRQVAGISSNGEWGRMKGLFGKGGWLQHNCEKNIAVFTIGVIFIHSAFGGKKTKHITNNPDLRLGFRDLLLICLPGCHISLVTWFFLHKTLVKSVVSIIAALLFLLWGHLEVKWCHTGLLLALFFDTYKNIVKPSFHFLAPDINRPGALALLFINFPSVNSFSTVSQVKQTPPLIPRPYSSSPSLSRNHNTPSPASPRDDFFTHGPFHSAPRVGLSCGRAVPALWLPRWPHSHCFSIACSRCELNWWTHSFDCGSF